MKPPVFDFAGKSVLVTGSSQNLGLSIAEAYVQAGARVILHAREASELVPAATHLRKRNPNAELHEEAFDLGQASSIESGFKNLRSRGLLPDILINNAAHLGLGTSGFLVQSPAFFREVLEVNLFGAFLCAQLAASHMCMIGGGAIVNISSLAGERCIHGRCAYNTSKAALEGLTRSMALDLARHSIRVNAITLGYVWTERWNDLSDADQQRRRHNLPSGQPCHPEEIAQLVLYTSSEASPNLTGASLVLDGGLSSQQLPGDVVV